MIGAHSAKRRSVSEWRFSSGGFENWSACCAQSLFWKLNISPKIQNHPKSDVKRWSSSCLSTWDELQSKGHCLCVCVLVLEGALLLATLCVFLLSLASYPPTDAVRWFRSQSSSSSLASTGNHRNPILDHSADNVKLIIPGSYIISNRMPIGYSRDRLMFCKYYLANNISETWLIYCVTCWFDRSGPFLNFAL